MKRWLGGALAAGIVAVSLSTVMRREPVATPTSLAAAVATLPLPAEPAPLPEAPASAPADAAPVLTEAPASPPADEASPAHWSMADAREHGDNRMPPLQRTPDAPAANAWELSDHAAYARREADLRARARADYVRATDNYLPELASGIARGRAEGVPAEAIAKMEAKLQRLQALRDELAQPAVN